MRSEEQDYPLSKLINIVEGELKFGMEIPETMITDAIKESSKYKYYKIKKDQSEKNNVEGEPEEKNVFHVVRGRDKVAVELSDSVSIEEQRIQQRKIMTQLTIEKQVEKDVEEGYAAERGQKLKGAATEDPAEDEKGLVLHNMTIMSLKTSQNQIVMQHEALNGQKLTRDDGATGFGVFMHNKSKELPKFTSFSPTITCSYLEDFTNLLNDPSKQELTDLLSKPVFNDAQTTSVVPNLEGNLEVLSYLSGASEVPFGINVDVQATDFILQEMFAADADHQVSSPPANTTHNLITNPQQKSIQEIANKLMAKAKQNKRKSNFKQEVEQKFKEYDQKLEALTSNNVLEPIKEDPPNDREGKTIKKRRKDAGEPSSRSSKKDKAPMDFVQEYIPADQSQDQEEEFIQKLPNTRWFTKKYGSTNAAKARKPNWFDILLKSDIDQNEDHILGLLTIAVAKKLKELVKKDELTITYLEGVVRELLKKQYKNYVELEYHVDQLKAEVLEED
ncbi:hypothetical protein Tco_1185092 [Tanacetum coccineum]